MKQDVCLKKGIFFHLSSNRQSLPPKVEYSGKRESNCSFEMCLQSRANINQDFVSSREPLASTNCFLKDSGYFLLLQPSAIFPATDLDDRLI